MARSRLREEQVFDADFLSEEEHDNLLHDKTLLELTDTPAAYDSGKYLKSTISGTEWATVSGASGAYVPPGSFERSRFLWKDADEIYINAGAYYLDGAWRRWNSQITFQFGSGGSNGGSTDLGPSDWFYLYLDHSTIGADTVLVASDFIALTTEPTWSNTNHGWYNGDDRCIFAVRTDGSSNILGFVHDGELVQFDDGILVSNNVDPDTTPTDSIQIIPKFTQQAQVTIRATYGDTVTNLYWRRNGTSGAGHQISLPSADSTKNYNTLTVITDDSGIIELWYANSGTNTFHVWTNGWYFGEAT